MLIKDIYIYIVFVWRHLTVIFSNGTIDDSVNLNNEFSTAISLEEDNGDTARYLMQTLIWYGYVCKYDKILTYSSLLYFFLSGRFGTALSLWEQTIY